MSLIFGEKIKESRKSQNLTQKQLAQLIGAAHNSISDWENNKNKPDPDTIELLCGALKITPNYLLNTSEDDFSPREKQIIKKFRSLDSHGKGTVEIILEREAMRINKNKNRNPILRNWKKTVLLAVYALSITTTVLHLLELDKLFLIHRQLNASRFRTFQNIKTLPTQLV